MTLLAFDKIPIIAIAYHRPAEFMASITSIFSNTDVPYKLTIIDNSCGAIDKELQWAENNGATIIRNDKNIGKGASFKKWFNSITEQNKSDFVVSLDTDIEVPQNWLSTLIRAANYATSISLQGFTSNEITISKFGLIAPMYTRGNGFPSKDHQIARKSLVDHRPDRLKPLGSSVYYNSAVCGALFLLSKQFYIDAGGYPGRQIYADDDGPICVYAWQNGYFAGFTSNVCVKHLDLTNDPNYNIWKHFTPESERSIGYWDHGD